MSDVPSQTLSAVMAELFTEAYAGSPHPHTWFTDEGPDGALFATLTGLTPEQASRPVGAGGLSIAAHTEHLRWSLALANAFVRGEQPTPDWEQSWTVATVAPETWDGLRAELRREYETLRAALSAQTDWSNPQMLTGALALIPHAAYHLGAIRQMAATSSVEF